MRSCDSRNACSCLLQCTVTRLLKFVCCSTGFLAECNCSAAFGSLQVRPCSRDPVSSSPCLAWPCTLHSHFLKCKHCEQHELDVRRATSYSIACATIVSA